MALCASLCRRALARTLARRGDPCRPAAFHGSARRREAVVISGVALARAVAAEVSDGVRAWVSAGHRAPRLAVVLVGDDAASATYVRNKARAAAAVGIASVTERRPASVSQEELLALVRRLNDDPDTDGLLVQLPVPDHVDERAVCDAVSPEKDVDGFHVLNVGRLCLDQRAMLPATPAGVWEILQRSGISTFGKRVVVAGRSKNVGMPIAMMLHTDGSHERAGGDATVTITHRYTPKEQLKDFTLMADIIIMAAGVPGLLTADMVRPGACVIDVGINRVVDAATGRARLVGDVDFEGVRRVAGHITPVPGGVGPMTVAMLMRNTLLAAQKALVY